MIEIEKNVPMPAKCHRGAESKYPWDAMQVGDSFFVAGRSSGGMTPPASLKAEGWKFFMRTEQKGVRVWRIA